MKTCLRYTIAPPLILLFALSAAVADAAAQTKPTGPSKKLTVPSNVAEFATLRSAAERGDADAQLSLGAAYEMGHAVPQDYIQAAVWYRKAAEQGNAVAQDFLGFLYDIGRGVPEDNVQAMAWYRKAAEQGDAGAMYALGTMYVSGKGVPQDYVEAHKWRNLAAARASTESQGEYEDARDAVARSMTSQQLAEAQKRASEWLAAFEKRQKY